MSEKLNPESGPDFYVCCKFCGATIRNKPGPIIYGICILCTQENLREIQKIMSRDNLQANIQRATDTCSNVLYHLQRAKFVATYPDKYIELVYTTEQSEKLRSELSALIEAIKSGDTDAPR